MNVFFRMISHSCEDTQVRITGMIDESSRAGEELAVDLVWGISETLIGAVKIVELVEFEEVNIFAVFNVADSPTFVGFLFGHDFAEIKVDKFAFFDIDCASDTLNYLVSIILNRRR